MGKAKGNIKRRSAVATKPGRRLEQLVATIEKALHGIGIETISPARLPDRETGEQREVDVLVRGRFGSTQILVAFECRDRGRVQNVMWVEELAGRKHSLGVDKLIAVSSNGFTAASIKKAKARGIELRTLSALTQAEVRRLVPFSELGIVRTDARLVGWSLDGSRVDSTELVGPVPTVASLDIKLTDRCLRLPGTTDLFSLQDLTQKYKAQILANANARFPMVRIPIADPSSLVGTSDDSEVLRVELKLPPLEEIWAGMLFRIERVELDVVTKRTFARVLLGPGQSYASSEAGEPIAVRFEADLPNTAGLPERIEVLVFPTDQRVSVSAINDSGAIPLASAHLGPRGPGDS